MEEDAFRVVITAIQLKLQFNLMQQLTKAHLGLSWRDTQDFNDFFFIVESYILS